MGAKRPLSSMKTSILTFLGVAAATSSMSSAQFGTAITFTSSPLSDFVPYDIDLDGDPDLLGTEAGSFGRLVSIENLGDGTYGTAQGLSTNNLTRAQLVLGDLSGDGRLDAIVAETNGDMWWYEYLGPLSFGVAQPIGVLSGGIEEIEAADLDGDGDLDFAIVSEFRDTVYWVENEGAGGFADAVPISNDVRSVRDVVIGDLNGDGRPDLVTASFEDDKVAWFENLGAGSFGPQRVISSGADGPRGVAVADLNGDGSLDVLSASSNDREVSWYRNLGTGFFGTQQIIGFTVSGTYSVGAADVNMDGEIDVYAGAFTNGASDVSWFEGLGFGFFGVEQVLSSNLSGSSTVRFYDADEDSDIDVVTDRGWTPSVSDLGTVYCTSNPNSAGDVGTIRVTGSTKRSLNAITLNASLMPPSTFGIFVTSRNAGMVVGPGGSQGVLCLGSSIGRYQGPTEILFTGVQRGFKLGIDLDAIRTPTGSTSVLVGETWRFQAWHRDTAMGMATSNFTEASAVTFD